MAKNFIKKIKILIYLYLTYLLLGGFKPALAGFINSDVFENENQDVEFGAAAGYNTGLDEDALATLVGTVIQAFLSLLGVIFVVLIIYAGYNWMIARGEEEKIEKAKDTLKRAIIGLAITIGAYGISYWVIYRIGS